MIQDIEHTQSTHLKTHTLTHTHSDKTKQLEIIKKRRAAHDTTTCSIPIPNRFELLHRNTSCRITYCISRTVAFNILRNIHPIDPHAEHSVSDIRSDPKEDCCSPRNISAYEPVPDIVLNDILIVVHRALVVPLMVNVTRSISISIILFLLFLHSLTVLVPPRRRQHRLSAHKLTANHMLLWAVVVALMVVVIVTTAFGTMIGTTLWRILWTVMTQSVVMVMGTVMVISR